MAAQRVTLLDSLDVEVALSAPTSMGAIPKGTVRMSLLDWEKGNSWDHLTMKIASILALEEHRSKALFMARIPFTPLLLVVEFRNWSFHKKRREEVQAKARKMLEGMHVDFKVFINALSHTTLDHVPLLVDTKAPYRGSAPFFFELMWLEELSLKDIVTSVWPFDNILVLKNNLADLLRKEEVFWFQCSWSKWVQEGDNNTKYFHAIANAKCRQNYLGDLRIPGVDNDNLVAMEGAIVNHFTDVFSCEPHLPFSLEEVPSSRSPHWKHQS
ncbi:hypothetical protein AMTRI_Chr01g131340 [Amborella trichopoda]